MAEQAGWAFGHVDGWTDARGTKRGFLGAVGVALGFPEHYGQNLDALADCLADLTVDTVLLWDGWSRLAHDDAKAFRISLDVLRERTGQAGAAKFVVLLRAETQDGFPDFNAVPSLE
ncbi:MAG: barstar family protein [Nocardioides sp.]|nr:barstar family protein [Nocardioides sp.]